MSAEVFDAIIVGAGQAGPAIAARCSREGLKTAVIERHHFGGTCVNVGCVPTKTLVASARAGRLAQRGAEFGFDVADLRVDIRTDARGYTVDKFQGQEAEIVIVSMTSSSEADLPRHIEFLYSRNRLNVAVSRAKCLAIVIANPALMAIRCRTPEQMALVNTLCWVAEP